jgi:hypothetical protein
VEDIVHQASPEEFARAIARAAEARGPDDPALGDPLVRQAYAIVHARRTDLASETCPDDVKARVQGLFGARPRSTVGAVLSLVLDSAAAPARAARGIARTDRVLRYSGEGATVDLQVRPSAEGDRRVYVAVTPPVHGMTFEMKGIPHGGARQVLLDDSGVGELDLPWRARCASASFLVEGGEAFRIESIDLG